MPTEAARTFIRDTGEMAAFMAIANTGAMTIPRAGRIQVEDPELRRVLNAAEEVLDAFPTREDWNRCWQSLTLSRVVDSFVWYFAETLGLVFEKVPESLSDLKVEVREVLRSSSPRDLLRDLARRRADELSYGGFRPMLEYLRTRLGVSIDISEEQLSSAILAVATRNAFVHNRGLASQRYIAETGRRDISPGSPVPLRGFGGWWGNLAEIVLRVDAAVLDKFGERLAASPVSEDATG